MAPESLPALNLRFCIGKCLEPMETAATYSRPTRPLLRALRASHTCRASRLPRGTCRFLAWPPHNPTTQVIPDATSPSQPAGHQEHADIHRGISHLSRRIQRAIRLRHIHLPLKPYCAPRWTCPSPMVQATTLANTEPPNNPANLQECLACLQKPAINQPRLVQRAGRSLGHSLRGSSHLAQWLNSFFALPPSVAPQIDASFRGGRAGGQSPQTLGAGISPQDSDRTPVENPQIQEVPPNAAPSLLSSERPPKSPGPPQTSL